MKDYKEVSKALAPMYRAQHAQFEAGKRAERERICRIIGEQMSDQDTANDLINEISEGKE